MSFYKNKEVLVTGGTGLIGRPLVDKLINLGAKVTVVSLDKPKDINEKINFINLDLRIFSNCIEACKNKELVLKQNASVLPSMKIKCLEEIELSNFPRLLKVKSKILLDFQEVIVAVCMVF